MRTIDEKWVISHTSHKLSGETSHACEEDGTLRELHFPVAKWTVLELKSFCGRMESEASCEYHPPK